VSNRPLILLLLLAALTSALRAAGDPNTSSDPNAPADNLDYWLRQAQPADPNAPGVQDPQKARREPAFRRGDALPGAIRLSDGTLLAGGLYTTIARPLAVFVDARKRWRRVPLAAVLSIDAVVTTERMELKWRWKAMGEPEKVYTGEKYPLRKLQWKLRLIDGSTIVGKVKGQPLWIETRDGKKGPFIFHDRQKGEIGSEMDELVYLRRLVVSRKMMNAAREHLDKVTESGEPDRPATRPARPAREAD
jgi:hypothetical protein